MKNFKSSYLDRIEAPRAILIWKWWPVRKIDLLSSFIISSTDTGTKFVILWCNYRYRSGRHPPRFEWLPRELSTPGTLYPSVSRRRRPWRSFFRHTWNYKKKKYGPPVKTILITLRVLLTLVSKAKCSLDFLWTSEDAFRFFFFRLNFKVLKTMSDVM